MKSRFLNCKEPLEGLTRLEIINSHGRVYVNKDFSKLELSIQDEGGTLKVFITDNVAKSNYKTKVLKR